MPARYLAEVLRGLQQEPDQIAVVCGSRSLTHREMLSTVRRLARALNARGLRKGTGLTCLMGNSTEALMTRLAANVVGCRFTGLNPYFGAAALERVLADSQPTALLVESVLEGCAAKLLRGVDVPRVFALGPSEVGEDLLSVAERQPDHALPSGVQEDELAQVTYTSGTTGTAKGVGNSFRQLAAFVAASRTVFGPGFRRLLITNPVTHLGGEMALWTLAEGGTVVLHDHESPPAAVLADIEAKRISHMLIPPSQLYKLAETEGSWDLSSVRRIVYGGAPAVPTRTAKAMVAFGSVLCQTYALRETGFVTMMEPSTHQRSELLNSVGWPLPGVEVVIRDEYGDPLPPGEVGEITVRSDSVMTGYWNSPDLTAQVLCSGWLHTGDLGRQDQEGCVYLVDRIKDVVIVNGFNVYSRPIEDVLTSHPAILHAVVVAVPNEMTGEAIFAAVVRNPGAEVSADDLCGLVRARLGERCTPAAVDFVDEILLTAAGKPDKKALRARCAA